MTLFTEGRLQAYERMMQDTGRNHRREKPESDAGKIFAAKKPVKNTSGRSGERHGCVPG